MKMRMLKRREETVLPSISDSAINIGISTGTIHRKLQRLPSIMSIITASLGGRRKITKALAILAVIHCLYTVSRDPNTSLRRVTSSSTSTPFQSNEKTLPLELVQALHQAGLAGDSATPATALTSDSARSMTGAALHGGPTTADSLSDTTKPGEIPEETDPEAIAYLRNMAPGDPNYEELESAEQDSERSLGVFNLFGGKSKMIKDDDASDPASKGQDVAGKEGSVSDVDPADMSLLLHNLDPGAIQKMDAATLQKVMEVNNINPKVLPSLSDSSVLVEGAALGENEVMSSSEGSSEAPKTVQGNALAESSSSPNGFLGSPFKHNESDDIGTTILDGAKFDAAKQTQPKQLESGVDLASLVKQFGGNEQDLAAALAQLNGNGNGNALNTAGASGSTPSNGKPPPPPQCKKAPRIPAPKQIPVKPTMNASYPGSGARLSWKLIRAITGLMTSDDAIDTNELSKQGLVVSIKSHYPAHGSSEALFKPFSRVDRSVLLIRNPIKSMPSFLSYLYEQENGLENHSTRVPLERWVEWRDEHFHKELQSWVHHTLFWMEHNAPENTLIVSYERLIDPQTGPDELLRMGQFLEESSGQKMAQEIEDIPCVWDFIVNSRGDTSVNGKTPQSLRNGPKVFPYTDEQIDTLVHYLSSLQKIYPEELGPMMDGYVVDTLALKALNTNRK